MSEQVTFKSIREARPHTGEIVILCLKGVVQHETYTYDQGDNDYGMGEYFWSRDDVDTCPTVTDDDLWMPLPTLQHGIAPPDGYVLVPIQLLDDAYQAILLGNEFPVDLRFHKDPDETLKKLKAMLSEVKP